MLLHSTDHISRTLIDKYASVFLFFFSPTYVFGKKGLKIRLRSFSLDTSSTTPVGERRRESIFRRKGSKCTYYRCKKWKKPRRRKTLCRRSGSRREFFLREYETKTKEGKKCWRKRKGEVKKWQENVPAPPFSR